MEKFLPSKYLQFMELKSEGFSPLISILSLTVLLSESSQRPWHLGWKVRKADKWVNGTAMFQQSDQGWLSLAEAHEKLGSRHQRPCEWPTARTACLQPWLVMWSDSDETGRKWVTRWAVYCHENKCLPEATMDYWAFFTRQTGPLFPWKAALPAKGGNLGTDNAMEGPGFQSQVKKVGQGGRPRATCSVDLGGNRTDRTFMVCSEFSTGESGPTANRQDTKRGQLNSWRDHLLSKGRTQRSHRMVPWATNLSTITSPRRGGLRGGGGGPETKDPWAGPDRGRPCLGDEAAPVMQGER